MTHYMPPRSDAQRLLFLQRIYQTAARDHAQGHFYLSPTQWAAIGEFLPVYDNAYRAVADTLSRRSRAVTTYHQMADRLGRWVRDFWAVLRRRTDRLEYAPQIHAFYSLPLQGRLPRPRRPHDWLSWAERIVQGEEEAIAANYPAMQNPSAAEVAVHLEAAWTARTALDMADRAHDQAQEHLAALRGEADRLLAEAMAELRFQLRHESPPSQRRILRTYGANFRAKGGVERAEPREEEGVEVPNAPH